MNKIEITNNAQEHIASVLKKDSASYFRITVLGGGCAGFQYKFDFENLQQNNVNSATRLLPLVLRLCNWMTNAATASRQSRSIAPNVK